MILRPTAAKLLPYAIGAIVLGAALTGLALFGNQNLLRTQVATDSVGESLSGTSGETNVAKDWFIDPPVPVAPQGRVLPLEQESCGGEVFCPNTICDPGEDVTTCPRDCVNCRDGVCVAGEEPYCPEECGPEPGFCGDGTCNPAIEDSYSCEVDCGPLPAPEPSEYCGDGTCNGTEDSNTCSQDCPAACGNRTCEAGEEGWCTGDCGEPFVGSGKARFALGEARPERAGRVLQSFDFCPDKSEGPRPNPYAPNVVEEAVRYDIDPDDSLTARQIVEKLCHPAVGVVWQVDPGPGLDPSGQPIFTRGWSWKNMSNLFPLNFTAVQRWTGFGTQFSIPRIGEITVEGTNPPETIGVRGVYPTAPEGQQLIVLEKHVWTLGVAEKAKLEQVHPRAAEYVQAILDAIEDHEDGHLEIFRKFIPFYVSLANEPPMPSEDEVFLSTEDAEDRIRELGTAALATLYEAENLEHDSFHSAERKRFDRESGRIPGFEDLVCYIAGAGLDANTVTTYPVDVTRQRKPLDPFTRPDIQVKGPGIECPSRCTARFGDGGARVKLDAVPGPGTDWTFKYWFGDSCPCNGSREMSCEFIVDRADITCFAGFELSPPT